MRAEILRPRDATELNNDKLGDVQCTTKQNRIYIIFSERDLIDN